MTKASCVDGIFMGWSGFLYVPKGFGKEQGTSDDYRNDQSGESEQSNHK